MLRWSRSQKKLFTYAITLALAVVAPLSALSHQGGSSPSNHNEHNSISDYQYWPRSGIDQSWNGWYVYLSPAHHWVGEKLGCNYYNGDGVLTSYSEDGNMRLASLSAATGAGHDLRARGYAVRVGRADPDENTIRSNGWGTTAKRRHIAIHSNASTSYGPACTGTASGTRVYWRSSTGSALATQLKLRVGASSPGSDSTVYGSFHELTQTTAVAAYLETAFHDNATDVYWLVGYTGWTWRIGWAVDAHLGYP